MSEIVLNKKMENIFGIKEFLDILDTHSGKDLRDFFDNEVFEPIWRAARQKIIPELDIKQNDDSESSDEDDVVSI